MKYRIQTKSANDNGEYVYYSKLSHPVMLTNNTNDAQLFDEMITAKVAISIMNNPELWEVMPVRDHTPSASGEGY